MINKLFLVEISGYEQQEVLGVFLTLSDAEQSIKDAWEISVLKEKLESELEIFCKDNNLINDYDISIDLGRASEEIKIKYNNLSERIRQIKNYFYFANSVDIYKIEIGSILEKEEIKRFSVEFIENDNWDRYLSELKEIK